MAPTTENLFEENRISLSVHADASLKFFQDHGIFYESSAAIGQLVHELDSHGLAWKPDVLRIYMPVVLEDARLRAILKNYDTEHPSLCYYLESDNPNHYFASSIESTEAEDHRAVIYMWSANSHIEIFQRSYGLPSKGVKAANGLYEVPYPFLTKAKGLRESAVRWKEGGIMIVHPRFAFGSLSGCTMAYAVQENGYEIQDRAQSK